MSTRNDEVQICREYLAWIMQRGVRSTGHPLSRPDDFIVDWDDEPSRFKLYQNATRQALPYRLPAQTVPLAELASAQRVAAQPERLSYEQLSTLLLLTNGLLRRKLDINWSQDNHERHSHVGSAYSRPAASGGGMYPFELYLVAGTEQAVLPGVYHYDGAHHALAQLALGDTLPQVRAATFAHPPAQATSLCVILSINFWKNYFKYHNFSYQLVTQDLGCALAALQLAASALGIGVEFILWFKDELLNRILGLQTLDESVFAVVALKAGPASEAEGPLAQSVTDTPASPASAKLSYQRSKRVFRLPEMEKVHQSALVQDEPRPPLSVLSEARCADLSVTAASWPLPPPAPELLASDLIDVFHARRSSWGRMTAQPAMSLPHLATALWFAASGQDHACDLKPADSGMRWTRLMLIVNHVQGVPAGAYAYDAAQHCLKLAREGDFALALQQSYFLDNYNLEQAAAVVAIVGDPANMFETFGNRGLRLMNAEVGFVAQFFYMAAAMSHGCGALLGFDNVAINGLLGLAGTSQTSLLLVAIGCERAAAGDFDFKLV